MLVHASLEKKNPAEREHKEQFLNIKYVINKHTDQGAPIWKTFSLDSLDLVYLITCKVCQKLYIGQTKNTLRARLKQHLYYINHPHKQTELYNHFRIHGVENLIISGLESRTGWTGAQRVAAERRWIAGLQTLMPLGLNEIS